MVFFSFPVDARWDDQRAAVEFTVVLGEYRGTVRVHRRFRALLTASVPQGGAKRRSVRTDLVLRFRFGAVGSRGRFYLPHNLPPGEAMSVECDLLTPCHFTVGQLFACRHSNVTFAHGQVEAILPNRPGK